MKPIYFRSSKEWRAWLEENHGTATEVFVGFHKRATSKPSMTWSEAVDEALSFGWIDGVRRSVDDTRYTNRFTPRRPNSNWSAVNIAKVEALEKAGKMTDAGRAAFAKRRDDRSKVYSYEQRYEAAFEPEAERRFRANRKAWSYWKSQPPGYRATATFWAMCAKRAQTREKRLTTLIDDSAAGRRIEPLAPRRPSTDKKRG